MQLNPDQRRVVESDGHCLVVACPGSGKTRVITTKIGALLDRHPGARICAVTFTRDAAGELAHRVQEEIGETRFKSSCRIGTFHSLAIRQLRNHNQLGKVASPAEQLTFLRRAIDMSEPGMEFEDATAIIEAAKGSLEANEAQNHPLYLAYSKLLGSHNLCDLYDVIRDSVRLMRTGEVRPYPVQFMLVDEFQDTDHIQLEWVLEHARAGTKVTVVGDDDQSIYSWRGAMGYGGMLEFLEQTGGERITLGINYRCHAEILGAADRLIQNNQARIEKALVAGRGPGGEVTLERAGERDDEAGRAVMRIQADCVPLPEPGPVFRYTVPNGSWAVLARNRRLLDEVEAHLQVKGILYYRPPKESFWSRAPQSLLLSLLSALDGGNTSGVDHALSHGLGCRFGRKRARDVNAKLHPQLAGNFQQLIDGVAPPLEGLMPDEAQFVSEFAGRLTAWASQIAAGRYNFAIRAVAAWFGELEDGNVQRERIVGAGNTLCRLEGRPSVRVNAITTVSDNKGRPQGVQLQTMHGSKGLEFNKVWIIGADSATIPSPKSSNLDEERRLMYVAMTRAKDRLFISSITKHATSHYVTEAMGEAVAVL